MQSLTQTSRPFASRFTEEHSPLLRINGVFPKEPWRLRAETRPKQQRSVRTFPQNCIPVNGHLREHVFEYGRQQQAHATAKPKCQQLSPVNTQCHLDVVKQLPVDATPASLRRGETETHTPGRRFFSSFALQPESESRVESWQQHTARGSLTSQGETCVRNWLTAGEGRGFDFHRVYWSSQRLTTSYRR